jgi:hypothetical protein
MQEGVGPKPAQQAGAATYELKSEEVMATQRQTFFGRHLYPLSRVPM